MSWRFDDVAGEVLAVTILFAAIYFVWFVVAWFARWVSKYTEYRH